LQDPPKFLDFWFENKPSGNPDSDCYNAAMLLPLTPFVQACHTKSKNSIKKGDIVANTRVL
jgi:hypothetical protein